MNAMGNYIAAKHNGGQDQMPSRPWYNSNRRTADRRQAHDRQIDEGVAAVNRAGFLRRFPEARHISLR
jgi:hypothetical protein